MCVAACFSAHDHAVGICKIKASLTSSTAPFARSAAARQGMRHACLYRACQAISEDVCTSFFGQRPCPCRPRRGCSSRASGNHCRKAGAKPFAGHLAFWAGAPFAPVRRAWALRALPRAFCAPCAAMPASGGGRFFPFSTGGWLASGLPPSGARPRHDCGRGSYCA